MVKLDGLTYRLNLWLGAFEVKIKEFTLTAIFISIILLFAFTPIGFIHLGVIKATIIHIPVIIGSIVLGPKIGAILGFSFGMTSMITNTLTPSLLSFAFTPVIPVLGTSQGSFWALFIAMVPRVIIGVIPYYLFKSINRVTKKQPNQKTALFLSGLFATIIHTFLVMGFIALLFHDAYALAIDADGIGAIIIAVFTVFLTNGLAEAVLAAFITVAIVPPLVKLSKEK